MTEPFSLGQWLFLSSVGLVRVVGHAGRDANGKPGPLAPGAPPAFYALEGPEQTALVPVARASELVRPLVGVDEARSLLALLLADAPPATWTEALVQRGQKISGHGSALEHAQLLRELYALGGPLSSEQAKGLAFFERLVLPELARVLGRELAPLVAELHLRYPVAESLFALKIAP